MASLKLLLIFFALAASVLGAASEGDAKNRAVSGSFRERRHIRRRLCRRHGICQGFGGGFGGGFPGSQGGYPGSQGGYPGPLPVQIGITQSQSSANGAGGGYNHGQYPSNYQFNGGYPNGYHGYPNQGYPNQGYPNQGYPNQGLGPGNYGGHPFQGHRPGYNGPHNNQFYGNFYGPGQNSGYGFQRPPYGPYYDENGEEGNRPEQSEPEQVNHIESSGSSNNYEHGEQSYNQNPDEDYTNGPYGSVGRKNN